MKITLPALAFAAAVSAGSLAASGADRRAPQAVSNTVLTETPAWADRFVDSVGIDAKYEDGTYPTLVTQQLLWSKIRHLRDSVPPSAAFIAQMKYLGQHGVKHSIGMGRGFAASDLRARLAAFAPYVDYVEPANEADNYKIPNWALIRSDQKNLWTTVRSNSAWNNVAVAGPSFANPKEHAALVGPLDSYEDFGNLHNGTCNWNPGTSIVWVSIAANTTYMRETTTYKPIETTETGYNDNLTRGCSLSDAIIAKYIPRVSAERWLYGEPRTYFNVLTDNLANIVFGNLGLLHQDGTPKPQFIALGNLVRLLADPGTAPRPTRLTLTISGATADVHHITLARRDGSYDILLYRELPCWDHFKNVPIVVDPESIRVTVPGMRLAMLYKYNSAFAFDASTIAVGTNGKSASFPISDSISVFHFAY